MSVAKGWFFTTLVKLMIVLQAFRSRMPIWVVGSCKPWLAAAMKSVPLQTHKVLLPLPPLGPGPAPVLGLALGPAPAHVPYMLVYKLFPDCSDMMNMWF